jgi:hypothetical protein
VSGDTVTFDAVGTCLLDANESGNADYAAAPQVTASITVGQGSQMITFDPAPSATVGTTVALAASGGPSGNAVQWSTDPSTGPGVCAVSAGTVSFTAVGSCVIDANQVGSANYAAAPQVTATVTVGQSAQAISFSPALSGAVGNNVTLEATGGSSGNPVTFTVDPLSGPGVCGVTGPSGPTLSFTAVGSCVIDANQAGTANYNAAPQVVATVTVGPGSQSISFTTAPNAAVGQITTLAATGGASGDPVVFSLDPSSGSGVCAVSGPTLSFTAVGSCVIDANQAGTANYNAAPQITATVTVGPGSQSITVTSKPTRAVVGGPSYDFTATGGASGNPVVLTTLTPAVCTVSGSIVSFIGVGNCALRADQAGNSNYGAAPTRGQTFTVGPGSQKLTFTSKPPVKAVDGGPAYQFVVTGGPSGNPVTFTLTTPSVCALSGTSVSFVGLGTCTIDITQAGNADYKAAPPRTINIAVKSTSD